MEKLKTITKGTEGNFEITRRNFLKIGGAVTTGIVISNTVGAGKILHKTKESGTSHGIEGTVFYSVCPYCAVGCGMKIYVKDNKVVHVEGDEESPISRGSLCSKGCAAIQLIYNDFRVKEPSKKTGNGEWEKISWNESYDEISEKLKEIKDKYGANAVGFYGCSHATNEEDYLIQKIVRIFGTNNREHQARKCHASTVGALAPSFGRGAMTNHWVDIKNAKSIFIIGSNIVENHPVGFQWVTEAREKNDAKIVVADPRYTKTANKSDIYIQHRPGTDIALINGMCKEIIENNYYDKNYLMNRTNAPFLLNNEGKLIEIQINAFDDNKKIKIKSSNDNDKVNKVKITGKDENGKDVKEEISLNGKNFVFSMDKFSFISKIENEIALGEIEILDEQDKEISKIPANVKVYGDCYGAFAGVFTADEMKNNKDTIFSKLVENVSSYTLDEVEKITWVEKEKIKQVTEIFAKNKPLTILYSMGTTQHTTGVQYIRSYAVLQLLLGNVGVPGGGINAMRGIHNVQGATDMGLSHILPAYLAVPKKEQKLENYWSSYGKARLGKFRQNEIFNILTDDFQEDKFSGHRGGKGMGLWGISYEQLPKGNGYSSQVMLRKAKEGVIKALVIFGENPMVSSPNLNIVKEAFKNLELLVVVDIFESESAAAERNENSSTYMLPASTFAERAGSVTNSGRCVQWRYKAINPLYNSKSDLEILINLAEKLYEKGALNFDTNKFNSSHEAFNYAFNYGYLNNGNTNFDCEKVAENVLKEVMKCCWIYDVIGKYAGVIETRSVDEFGDEVINKGTNYAKRRDNISDNGEGVYPGWGWTWPINRHVLYYVYPEKGKNLEIQYKFKDDTYRPNKKGSYFIPNDGFLTKEGVAALGALTSPLKDGFLPKHMEPIESPYPDLSEKYPPYVKFDTDTKKNTSNVGELEIGDVSEFPYVLTTFRLLEHMLAGQTTRNIPYLVELEPEPFCEINEKLAKEKNINNNDYVKISTKRGSIKVKARVNGRVNEKTIAVTWHWGFKGLSTGDSANYLVIDAVDPNASIPEYKVALCNIEKA
ncbi:MAG: molybdopterin-dependent oxidoreductase [Candidatus Altiarchaeum hamiconexum]|uniref:Molybdopterin-dependent oxidoreductase n=1 Tax=Candidatus Altarchaeum hamiconexum TaxID=1803513 RepID=A0A8J8CKD1_9ARCH|nr:molybdopterin-dependent oxidoreductase [Candidatus Altarchaeum hamiconexum]OIQ06355.1 MAG: hypothetical protein AUK59_00180 [Candidatus Altarchaeum sp. CG2_30_32_3053]PIN67025.1 MAG: hypothetical protein COV98_05140 [Candidatus Altarchaeum sp. CG12_big_fil_rev_8_21_14_0_65_33_22]PIV27267.1 MAG: hypothetical protein COS36_06330 [Candidatus Altarchaeum sp. CG03_land_8_20_14_0_80_32_618]PIZ31689.1 MAG: hypothetical protein COY41_02220 [Candidatus Altarchaeum sp. CG_4_10_14_0_8_um_filter_32_851]